MTVLVRNLEGEIARRNVDRAKAADEAAFACPRRIDMALVGSIDKLRHRIAASACTLPKPQKHVVVAVEYRLHSQNSS